MTRKREERDTWTEGEKERTNLRRVEVKIWIITSLDWQHDPYRRDTSAPRVVALGILYSNINRILNPRTKGFSNIVEIP